MDTRTPVLVGVGELADRVRDPSQGKEPLTLMAEALRAAEADAGASLLGDVDSLDVIEEFSWPYFDAPALLSERIGARPARAVYGVTGGESPVRYIHEAAIRIARGESEIAAVAGAEAQYTAAAAQKTGIELPWAPRDNSRTLEGGDYLSPVVWKHQAVWPTQVYPFYDNAAQAAWGQTQREALNESGEVWADFAAVAAQRSAAWVKSAPSADAITTPDAGNRLIAWPYTKSMVANPLVNQGAAVILTSLGKARALGIDESKLVFILGGAQANEPRDYLARDQFHASHAQDVVLETAVAVAGGADGGVFSHLELYSCFPCVPKMARRTLGLPRNARMTVTGGLSFFGAPLNSYMLHAAVNMVQALRDSGELGLLYGQGEYVTKHHALVLSRQAPDSAEPAYHQLTDGADARRGDVPEMIDDYDGAAELETFTVSYDREGQPAFGIVIARTPDGRRLMARVPASDEATIRRLTDLDGSPIGLAGRVNRLNEELLGWTAAA